MNIQQLHYLVATIDCGSYAAAARKLFMSPSGISKSIDYLEKELGIGLLVRTGRTVLPTQAGLAICEHARKLIKEERAIYDLAGKGGHVGLRDDSRIVLAVAADRFRGGYSFMKAVNAAACNAGGVEISTIRCSSGAGVMGLYDGAADAATVLGVVNQPELQSSLLCYVHPLLLVKKNHPLTLFDSVSISNLGSIPIARPRDMRTYELMDKVAQAAGKDVRVVDVESEKEYVDLLLNGGGVFVADEPEIREIYSDEAFLSLEDDAFDIPAFFVYRENGDTSWPELIQKQIKIELGKLSS